MNYVIYTDGAYSPSRDQGGFGIVVQKDEKTILEYSKAVKNTTNNRMEISGVLYALKCVKKPVDSIVIISDSQYVLGCINKGWKREKNSDLWEQFDLEQTRVNKLCPNIVYTWTKGHADNEGNNRADELAYKASCMVLD